MLHVGFMLKKLKRENTQVEQTAFLIIIVLQKAEEI